MNRTTGILLVTLALSTPACDGVGPGPSGASVYADVPWERLDGRIAISAGFTEHASFVLDVLDAGRREVRRLISTDELSIPAGLSWSPDGDTLAFGAFTLFDGYSGPTWYQVYRVAANGDGGYANVAFDLDGHHSDPAYASDGRLAWLYNGLFGTGRSLRVGTRTYDVGQAESFSSPGWSPDGSMLIVSVRDSTSQGALYLLDPTDPAVPRSGFEPLLHGSGDYNDEIFHDPHYAPDGSRVVYVRWGAAVGGSEIWTMAPDGSDRTRLTSGENDTKPCWSPDGTQIAFLRGGAPHVMVADGSGIQRISHRYSGAIAWTR